MIKIAILGAGISGLAAAWYLKKKFHEKIELDVYEKKARVGGWIHTVPSEGFLFEEGPRGFRPTGKGLTTLELVHELNVQDELIGADSLSRRRYIALKGKLRPFSFNLLLQQGIISASIKDMFTPPTDAHDETIADFTCRRLNKRLMENIIDPFARGVFGGDCRKLSMCSCLPFMWNLEREKGSIIRGLLSKKQLRPPVSLYTFKEGMETLPKTLAKKLEANIFLSTDVRTLEEIHADYIISALPTSSLARLIGEKDPLEYATLTTVNCAWDEQVLKKRGYGFLVPSKERSEIFGMTWDSAIFPQFNSSKGTRICVMIGGKRSEDELVRIACTSLRDYLGISIPPLKMLINTAENAIPQYNLNYQEKIAAFRKKLPSRLCAIGNCFGGIGVNDCIFNAQRLVDTLSF